jgi:hypothetical protein
MNKVELIAASRAQWAETEASIAKAAGGNFEAAPSDGEWSAGNCYRHLIDILHKLPEAIEDLKAGRGITNMKSGDTDGHAAFAALNAKMLAVEMNTAHGIVWMALQKLTDADLDMDVELGGNKMKLGAFIEMITIGHEKDHIQHAFRSAGVAETVTA